MLEIEDIPASVMFESINTTYIQNEILCIGFARKYLFTDAGKIISMYFFRGDPIIHRFVTFMKLRRLLHRILDYVHETKQESTGLVYDLVFEHRLFSNVHFFTFLMHPNLT